VLLTSDIVEGQTFSEWGMVKKTHTIPERGPFETESSTCFWGSKHQKWDFPEKNI